VIQHADHMARCLELARIAVEAGNGPFGSVMVSGGRLITESHNQVSTNQDLTAHAEMRAIREACRALDTVELTGCTLYASAEPCFMCSYAIRIARVSQVVIGARAVDRGGVSSKYPILSDPDIAGWEAPPHIVREVLLDQCTSLLHEYGFYSI